MEFIIRTIKEYMQAATVQCFIFRLHRVMQGGISHTQTFPQKDISCISLFINIVCNTVVYLWT
jgi:hypothetical protein